MVLTGEDLSAQRKSSPNATLSFTKHTQAWDDTRASMARSHQLIA